MRSALPAPLTVLEERVIGPGLGADSIYKGALATVFAIVVVVAIMFAVNLFATFANIALLVNLILLVGGMAFGGDAHATEHCGHWYFGNGGGCQCAQ